MTKHRCPKCPDGPGKFRTTITMEMIWHSMSVHGAKFSRSYVLGIKCRDAALKRKVLLEIRNE